MDFEASPLPYFAVDIEKTPVALDDPQHRREPKPGAFANLFGGEKGLENLFEKGGRYAHPRIRDGDHHVGPGFGLRLHLSVIGIDDDVLSFHLNTPTVGHGIARVDTEVQ